LDLDDDTHLDNMDTNSHECAIDVHIIQLQL